MSGIRNVHFLQGCGSALREFMTCIPSLLRGGYESGMAHSGYSGKAMVRPHSGARA